MVHQRNDISDVDFPIAIYVAQTGFGQTDKSEIGVLGITQYFTNNMLANPL